MPGHKSSSSCSKSDQVAISAQPKPLIKHSFYTGSAGNVADAQIVPLYLDQDSSRPAPGVPAAGLWMDYNTDRDSIVITWNAVGQYYQQVNQPSTYQVELRDLGEGDAEIIYRFSDLTYPALIRDSYSSSVQNSFGFSPTPLSQIGTLDLWDDTPGNTGVTGV